MDPATRLKTFVDLVSALTGVSTRVAGQAQAAARYLENYTTAADTVAGSGATEALLSTYALLRKTLPPKVAAAKLLSGAVDGPSPDKDWPFSAMARTLMKFFLLGVWYDPRIAGDEGTIPTAVSYSESLVWLIGQAHAVGASKLAYGHWAKLPPPLKDLIG